MPISQRDHVISRAPGDLLLKPGLSRPTAATGSMHMGLRLQTTWLGRTEDKEGMGTAIPTCGNCPSRFVPTILIAHHEDTQRSIGSRIMVLSVEKLKELGFQPRKGYVHPDGRGRVTLGAAARDSDYRVLVNERGQILLDPVVGIPASEAWLWESPALRASMERAMQQAENDDFVDLGSFAEYADEDGE